MNEFRPRQPDGSLESERLAEIEAFNDRQLQILATCAQKPFNFDTCAHDRQNDSFKDIGHERGFKITLPESDPTQSHSGETSLTHEPGSLTDGVIRSVLEKADATFVKKLETHDKAGNRTGVDEIFKGTVNGQGIYLIKVEREKEFELDGVPMQDSVMKLKGYVKPQNLAEYPQFAKFFEVDQPKGRHTLTSRAKSVGKALLEGLLYPGPRRPGQQ
jgi:hypothetical protein